MNPIPWFSGHYIISTTPSSAPYDLSNIHHIHFCNQIKQKKHFGIHHSLNHWDENNLFGTPIFPQGRNRWGGRPSGNFKLTGDVTGERNVRAWTASHVRPLPVTRHGVTCQGHHLSSVMPSPVRPSDGWHHSLTGDGWGPGAWRTDGAGDTVTGGIFSKKHFWKTDDRLEILSWRVTGGTTEILPFHTTCRQSYHLFCLLSYLPVTNGSIFYMYFEAQKNPDTAPLIWWSNGGPGCSGLSGAMTENGPFRPQADGSLKVDEYSWNREANVVFVVSYRFK